MRACIRALPFVLIVTMAGLGLIVVNALAESAWATFTIFITIPLALVMGFYMFRWRRGHIKEATLVGVGVLVLSVIFGKNVAASSIGHWFELTHHQVVIGMALYTIAASVLPVWMLLTPRAYLSTFLKLGTIGFLVIGVMIINPKLEAPAFSEFVGGGGPIFAGPLFPFVFITIACGAISGFHVLISTGTTSKMIDKESDIRPIGYGGMLMECVVGVVALITASALHPADYYAINTPPAVFETLGMPLVNLPDLQSQIGETVVGRTGGGVSLAVGMAQIFSSLPGMRGLMAYWYHFAIMFEAVFILTTIDSGTRVGRFLVQEFGGRVWKPLARTDWLLGNVLATVVIVAGWAYFIWTGNISSIWPMFGVANQLLASVSLGVATTLIINLGRAKYAWVTFVPLCWVATTTLTAGYLIIRDQFWPMAIGAKPELHVQGYVNSIATALMMMFAVIILTATSRRSLQVLTGRATGALEPSEA